MKKALFIIAGLLLFASFATAQEILNSQAIASFGKYGIGSSIRVFPHSNVAKSGERLFFSIWKESPQYEESAVYFSLIGPCGRVAHGSTLLKNGTGQAYFDIKEDFASGIYAIAIWEPIAANWHKPAHWGSFIHVINRQFKESSSCTGFANQFLAPSDWSVHTEGQGSLNLGESNKIVTLLGEAHHGKKLQIIQDQEVLVELSQTGFINELRFYPQAERNYRLVLKDQSDVIIKEQLLELRSGQAFLKLETLGNYLLIQGAAPMFGNEEINLIIAGREGLHLNSKIALKDGKFAFRISKSELPKGLQEAIISNVNGKPLLSRMFYLSDKDQSIADLKITADDLGMPAKVAVRSKISLDLAYETQAQMAWSVASKVNQEVELSILSLPFAPIDVNNKEAWINNWLFTSDISLYHFAQKENPKTIFQEVAGVVINGKVKNKQAEDSILFLSIPSNREFYYGRIAPDGSFAFPEIKSFGMQEIYFKMASGMPEIDLVWEEKFPDTLVLLSKLPMPVLSTQWQEEEEKRKIIEDNFFYSQIGEELKLEKVENRGVKGFFGQPTFQVDISEYEEMPDMKEVFLEYLPDARLRKRKDQYVIRLINKNEEGFKEFKNQPLLLVDGDPVFDANLFANISPQEVGLIQVLNYQYFLGEFTFDGIVAVYSRPGTKISFDRPGSYTVQLQPIQAERTFPQPIYSNDFRFLSKKPDLRRYLNWESTGGRKLESRYKHSLYTGDELGRFRLHFVQVMPDGSLMVKFQDFENEFAK